MTKDEIERIIARLERGWCKGAHARNVAGKRVIALSPNAVAWCAAGAALVECTSACTMYRLQKEFELRFGRSIESYNDSPRTTLASLKRRLRKLATDT